MHLLLPILFSLSALAAPPPGFNAAKFTALVQKAAESGERMPAGDYDYRVLKRMTPSDPAKTHLAEYFSDVGVTETSGRFDAFGVSVVSEDWRKQANGDWHIEQWLWTAGLDGELQQVNHFLLKENADGSVISDDGLPCGQPTDAAEIRRWVKQVALWE